MPNSGDPDEMAHDEPSHLDLLCLQTPIIMACGNERVNTVEIVSTKMPLTKLCRRDG